MSRLMSILLISAILIIVAGKESWQCDSSNTYRCSNTQTCCKSTKYNSSWACFNSVNAVCCSDGIHACPAGYTCNLRDNRCDPTPK